jgi:hypothetical protein
MLIDRSTDFRKKSLHLDHLLSVGTGLKQACIDCKSILADYSLTIAAFDALEQPTEQISPRKSMVHRSECAHAAIDNEFATDGKR